MGLVWWDKDTQLLRGVQYLNVMKNLKGGKKKTTKILNMSYKMIFKIWKIKICFEIVI